MHFVKTNLKTYLIITGCLCVLIAIIMGVFDPSTMKEIAKSSQDEPVNPLGDITTLIAFVSNQYFGNFALIFAMIYSIIIGNKLVADQVDKGSMAYHLSTPITRTEYTATSAIYFVSSLALMFGFMFTVGWGVAEMVQPGELPIGIFFTLTVASLLLHFAISGITFLASCLFSRASRSLAMGAGLTVFFFAANLLSGMSDSLKFLKNMTIISLFDSNAIIHGESYAIKLIILAGIGIILYVMGITAFKRKDLPL